MSSGFNLSALAVRERSVTLFFLLLTAFVGVYSLVTLGRAEDPAFTVRIAVVSALWPGASAQQMQDQVADRLEQSLQGVDYFYKLETISRPGRVDLVLELQDYSPRDQVPQYWDQVRKRMVDEAPFLPEGVIGPFVNDEFSDVYFTLYALTAEGLPQRLLVREAEKLRDRFTRVAGVKKVRVIGERAQRVYVELDQDRLANLGIMPPAVLDALQAHNRLLPAGLVESDGPRIYWRVEADLVDLDAIRAVPIRAGERVLRLGEIAEVRRGYEEPATYLVRSRGQDAVLLGVVMQEGENGLDLGERLDAAKAEIDATLPLGMGFEQLTNQATAIARAVNLFQLKFGVAVAVVMLVTFVSLGVRPGVIVGVAVPLTLGVTFLLMLIKGISLDRISLGALIIALGLLVDDAIIAIEMMLVKLEEGWERAAAAAHAWTVTAAPMLSGTLVTAIGFVPIGFARSSTGEYTGSIFWVLAFALLTSWVVAVTFTPYLGVVFLGNVRPHEGGEHGLYQTPLYRRLRRVVEACVRWQRTVVAATVGALALAVAAMIGPVENQFFPTSDRPEVIVDVFLPQGSSLEATDAVTRTLEALLAARPEVRSFSSYVGAGAPRFLLALNPEMPDAAFAKLLAFTGDAHERNELIAEIDRHSANGEWGAARVRATGLLYGPPIVWPVTFRVVGPDPQVLRAQAERVREVMAKNPNVVDAHLDWGERAPHLRLDLDPERLRRIGLTPRELAQQLQLELDGVPATELREDVRSVRLVVRGARVERASLGDVPLKTLDGRSITLAQAGLLRVEMEDPVLKKYDREPVIAVHSDARGAQPEDVTAAVLADLGEVLRTLPPGYRIDVGGSVEQSVRGERSLQKIQPIMLALMLIVVMLQMRTFSGTFLVLATAPLGVIGAALALLVFRQPFGFVALLGLIGLAGILIRNTLILTKQIHDNLDAGLSRADAVVEATVRRARPVVLTALAAVLAFIPLATDSFWGPLAYVLIGGTAVGTLVTLLFLPALYALFYRIRLDGAASATAE
jgi:multidrug efflux pump subunit AcrB